MQAIDGIVPWIFFGLSILIAADCFASAFIFPHRRREWANRNHWLNKRRIPMSVRGRIAMGVYFGSFGVGAILSALWPAIFYFWMAVTLVLMIPVYLAYLRDKQNYMEPPEIPKYKCDHIW
jgi:hypothetical protein